MIGSLISTFGNNVYSIALPWFVYSLTNSKADLTLVGLANFVPPLLGLFMGVFVDRWRKKRTMMTVDLLRTVIALSLCGLAVTHEPVVTILICAFVLEFTGTFFSPASTAFLPTILKQGELAEATGFMQSGNASMQLTGTIGGGALIAWLHATGLFLVDAVTFLVSYVSLLFIRTEDLAPRRSASSSFFTEWTQGVQLIFKGKLIRRIVIGACIANFAMAPVDILMTAWVKGPVHGNATTLGFIFGSFFVGMMIGGMILGAVSKKMDAMTIFRIGMTASGVLTMLLPLWPNMWWAMSCMAIEGVFVSQLNGSVSILLLSVVPEHMRGRLFSILNGVVMLASPLGIGIFGALVVAIKLAAVFLMIGGLVVVSGLVFMLPITNDIEHWLADAQA